MRWPIRRRWMVQRYKSDPFSGTVRPIEEDAPAPARRLFWSRSGAEIEALRLSVTVARLRRSNEDYRAVPRP